MQPTRFAKLFDFELDGQLLVTREVPENEESKYILKQRIQYDDFEVSVGIGFTNEEALERAFEKYSDTEAEGFYSKQTKFVNNLIK